MEGGQGQSVGVCGGKVAPLRRPLAQQTQACHCHKPLPLHTEGAEHTRGAQQVPASCPTTPHLVGGGQHHQLARIVHRQPGPAGPKDARGRCSEVLLESVEVAEGLPDAQLQVLAGVV